MVNFFTRAGGPSIVSVLKVKDCENTNSEEIE